VSVFDPRSLPISEGIETKGFYRRHRRRCTHPRSLPISEGIETTAVLRVQREPAQIRGACPSARVLRQACNEPSQTQRTIRGACPSASIL